MSLCLVVDAWAKSGEGGAAATRAEAILQHMNNMSQKVGHEGLRPTTGIFNAVINAWARSREQIAPTRAEQILEWMDKLHRNGNLDVQPDKYTFNTVIHAWAKLGGKEAAEKAQQLLDNMHRMNNAGNLNVKPDTITVSRTNCPISMTGTTILILSFDYSTM
jgi:predicted ArsR family transcriptional regulator